MTNLTTTVMYNIDDEQMRTIIVKMIDQYYWSDNGGETDGPAYLIESSELTDEQRQQLNLQTTTGTYLDGYAYDEHAEVLNSLKVNWTGWQAEGYALIDADVEKVREALERASQDPAPERLAWNAETNRYECACGDNKTLYVDGDVWAEERLDLARELLQEKHPDLNEGEICELLASDTDEADACFDQATEEMLDSSTWSLVAVELGKDEDLAVNASAWIK